MDELGRLWQHEVKLGTVILEAGFGILVGLAVGGWTNSWLAGVGAGVLAAALGLVWDEASRRARRSQIAAAEREEDLRRRVTELEHELAHLKTEQPV
jgi:hypothetical protein